MSIGKTFQNRILEGFFLTESIEGLREDKVQKNILLVTGVHHSREPLTLTMIMLMIIEILKQLRHH